MQKQAPCLHKAYNWGDFTMRLSAPKFIIFIISVVLAALSLLPMLGIVAVSLPISGYWLLAAAWGLLTAGVVFKGM